LQKELKRLDYAGGVFFDPLIVRYATGSRNMSVWLLRNLARYCFVPVEGKPTLFGFPNFNCQLLSRVNEILAEVRPAKAHAFTMAAEHRDTVATAWAAEIVDLLRSCGGLGGRLAIDRLDPPGYCSLVKHGVTLGDGLEVAERARLVKSVAEIELIDNAVRVAERGIDRMQNVLRPGLTESELGSNYTPQHSSGPVSR
jgi:Xaa-Pro dipeptidase